MDNLNFTCYYANTRNLGPVGIIPIGISLYMPNWWTAATYQPIAPTKTILAMKDPEQYSSAFMEYLNRLDPTDVVKALGGIAGPHPWAICCYEMPGAFCHRHLVAKWLMENSRQPVQITEFNKQIHTLNHIHA